MPRRACRAVRKTIHTDAGARLAAMIRDARLKAGLTQRELADRLGWPHQTVSKIEQAERRVDLVVRRYRQR